MKAVGFVLSLLALALVSDAAGAERSLGEAASIKNVEFRGDPKPGASVTTVVTVDLEKDYHVHSNQPSEEHFIATVLEIEAPAGISVGKIKYPKSHPEKVTGIDKPLSVYREPFAITVPLTIRAGTTLPAKLSATLNYQACRGAQCFRPQALKFDLIVPAR